MRTSLTSLPTQCISISSDNTQCYCNGHTGGVHDGFTDTLPTSTTDALLSHCTSALQRRLAYITDALFTRVVCT